MKDKLPPKLKELAAGYVLGNLDPEELQEFYKLSADFPDQEAFIAEMQDVMNELPFILEPQRPSNSVRDRLFTEVSTPAHASSNSTPNPGSQRPWFWIPATAAVVILGGYTLSLRQDLQLAQTQLQVQNEKLAQLQEFRPQSQEASLQIKTSPKLLQANWNGISLVLEDHLRAQTKGASAVEIEASSHPELFQKLQENNFSLPQPTPSLALKDLDFLGGSLCKFDKTKGVRIMYENAGGQPVSFYQLKRASTPEFPLAISEQLLIQNSKGPNLMLWGMIPIYLRLLPT
ncbi:MAG: hypothetical protein HC810_05035 [Acaryochloridaceae cyanobacterium RL_2_7]|nr:hypothetical protein [Acaryochloridaceae cyanobacterium RL_2_7]